MLGWWNLQKLADAVTYNMGSKAMKQSGQDLCHKNLLFFFGCNLYIPAHLETIFGTRLGAILVEALSACSTYVDNSSIKISQCLNISQKCFKNIFGNRIYNQKNTGSRKGHFDMRVS